jgi:hypothetical protein
LIFNSNHFIRGFIGDAVIVMMMYFFFMIFYRFNTFCLAAIILIFSFSIEFMQYLRIFSDNGLEDNPVIKLIFGSVFDPLDLLAYAIGVTTAMFIDLRIINPPFSP